MAGGHAMKRASRAFTFALLGPLLSIAASSQTASAHIATARIDIDATKVKNKIDPRLFGQFTEFMFQDIKGGLHAELLRDRSFEEPANDIGLPGHWEREPDDRNDDPDLRFKWDSTVAYPDSR